MNALRASKKSCARQPRRSKDAKKAIDLKSERIEFHPHCSSMGRASRTKKEKKNLYPFFLTVNWFQFSLELQKHRVRTHASWSSRNRVRNRPWFRTGHTFVIRRWKSLSEYGKYSKMFPFLLHTYRTQRLLGVLHLCRRNRSNRC